MILIIKLIMSLAFLSFGFIKLSGEPKNMYKDIAKSFKRFKLDKNMIAVTGAGEIVGIILLWLKQPIGAALLLTISGLALLFHLRYDKLPEAGPAIVMAILSALVLFLG